MRFPGAWARDQNAWPGEAQLGAELVVHLRQVLVVAVIGDIGGRDRAAAGRQRNIVVDQVFRSGEETAGGNLIVREEAAERVPERCREGGKIALALLRRQDVDEAPVGRCFSRVPWNEKKKNVLSLPL